MAMVRIGGPGINLPTFPGLATQRTGSSAGTIRGVTNAISLAASESFLIPSGTYEVTPGPYTFLQWYDPVSTWWRTFPTGASLTKFIESDGTNWRLANLTGCVVGAVITTATATGAVNGIGTTINGLSAVASSGASTWQTIVGGSIGATIATSTANGTTAGSGYTYPPIVIIDAPPTGGLQATAFCSLSGGSTVTAAAITVVNQGAGYATAPQMTFVNDPRDTTGGGALYVTTLTATGTLTGLYPTNNGTPLAGLPALTFSVAGVAPACAATAIMNFCVTTNGALGTGGSSIGSMMAISSNNVISPAVTSVAVVNPLHANSGLTFPRPARINLGIAAGVAVISTEVVEDNGLGIQQVPVMNAAYTITSTTAVVPQLGTPTVGGVTDTSFLQPI